MLRALSWLVLTLPLVVSPALAKRADVRIAINLEGEVWVEPSTIAPAVKPLFDTMARKVGVTYSMRTANTLAELERMLVTGEVNLVGTSSLTYVRLSKKIKLIPFVRPVAAGSASFKLLVLVRRDAKVKNLAQLEGQKISLPAEPPIHQAYWDVLVAREGIKKPASFFGEVTQKKKAQSAVLDVFLGEAAACVIADRVYKTMAELNPQLPRTLTVIHTSTSFSNFPISVTPKVPTKMVEEGKKMLLKTHKTKEGRQVLLMFKVDSLVSARPEDYRSTEALWKEHEKLVHGKKK